MSPASQWKRNLPGWETGAKEASRAGAWTGEGGGEAGLEPFCSAARNRSG